MVVPAAYEIELGKIDKDLGELYSVAARSDVEKTTRFVWRLYQCASLTGNLAEFETAETAIEAAIRQVGPWPDICLLKANLDFKFHRLADVKRDLALAPGLCESLPARILQADLDLQEGRYAHAKSGYEAAIQEDRSWDNLARLAHWKAKFGEVAEAERLYVEAQDEITAKDMRSYAWVELQRGLLDLQRGRYEETAAHYERAGAVYPGYWLIDEHMAEILGALGKFAEAIAMYESVLARTPRPEIQQAFGELYLSMGKPDRAEPWLEKARGGYLLSVERGGVHYFHHLVDFYSDVREDGAEAVKWARKDIAVRRSFATQAALAWALYRDGQISEALENIQLALASGVQDARIFGQGARICEGAGRMDEGKEFARRAFEINPHHQTFHVHR